MYSYLVFFICSIFLVSLYLFWKYGYKVQKLKYLTIPSVAGALLMYLFNFNNFKIVGYSSDLFIRVFFFFLLCFLVAITIIVFTASMSQENNAEKKQPLIKKEEIVPEEQIEKLYSGKALTNKENDVNPTPNNTIFNKEKTVETKFNLNFSNNISLEPKDVNEVKKDQKKDDSLANFKNVLKKLSQEESREFLD